MTDGVRLYSKPSRLPVDVVAPQHAEIHAELSKWGAWNRDRYEPGACESIEHRFDNTGGRRVKTPQIALPPNPMLREIDRVVRLMGMRVPKHGETIKIYYVGKLRDGQKRQRPGELKRPRANAGGLVYIPCDPAKICRLMVIRWEDFPKWMHDCRSMVVNLLQREGVPT